jgi:hypothetical protein
VKVRYLVLADIHGNIEALNAIEEPFDHQLILGDFVDYGAAPEAAIRWERRRCDGNRGG